MVYFYGNDYRSFSFGIVCEYEFVRVLNKHGIDARMICYEPREKQFPIPEIYTEYVSYEPEKVAPGVNDMVVYPETIKGNPLKAKRVIRWLLNRPYSLTSEGIEYGGTDLVFAYSKYVNPGLPQMFYLPDERELFENIRKNGKHSKRVVAVYFGKTHMDVLKNRKSEIQKILSVYEEKEVITRLVPSERDEALRMIADSDMLLSFDPLSNMNFEANLLGVPVYIFEDAYGIRNREFNVPLRFAFSLDDIEEKRKGIDTVFDSYCQCIEEQETKIVENIKHAAQNFEDFEKDEVSAAVNKKKNAELAAEDLQAYHETWKNVKPFAVILSPSDLPFYISKMFGLGYTMKNAAGRMAFLAKDFLRVNLDKVGLLEPVRRLRKKIKMTVTGTGIDK